MEIAKVEHDGQRLCIRRLNAAYLADIRSGLSMWIVIFLSPAILYGLSVAFNSWLRHMGGTPTSDFLSPNTLMVWALLTGFIVSVNLFPSFAGLASPQVFCFDRANQALFVEGKKVSNLDHITLRLQDGWGPSRRAFRLVVSAGGRNYVLAQTQRLTASTFAGKEYGYLAVNEGRQSKYQLRRWANYEGQTTGFSKDWPGYAEIFALHDDLAEYISPLGTEKALV